MHKVFVTVFRGETLAGQYALDLQDPAFKLAATPRPLADVVVTFIREGIHHIFIGPDHILFVLALILLGGSWHSQVKIITAFTLAHSITLTLATLDIVQLPSRLVESVIALSIIVVGLHDLRKLRKGRVESAVGVETGFDPRITMAFTFGLVHGFGFASVLKELDLPQNALAWSLGSFNAGVEIGQLLIVLVTAPLLWLLHQTAKARVSQAVLMAGAYFVISMGSFWLWQRVLAI